MKSTDNENDTFSSAIAKDMKTLLQELEQESTSFSQSAIENEQLKQKVVRFCLKAIAEAEENKISVESTAHLLTRFVFFTFEDSLDEIFEDAGILELPQDLRNGHDIQLSNLKMRLLQYLD